MSDETKNGESADIDPNASKADLKAAADAMLKNARAQAAETMAVSYTHLTLPTTPYV